MADRIAGPKRLGATALRSFVSVVFVLAASAIIVPAPAAAEEAGLATGSVKLYTSVTQDTVDAVLAVLAEEHPDLRVEVFRAPTGELDARIAAERRRGGLGADVLWMTDPLSIQRYEADGLLRPLEADAFPDVPAPYRGGSFVGTRLLNLVIVVGRSEPFRPDSWSALTAPALVDGVVMPDPGFAGSAFAALAYFSTAPEYGIDYYAALKANGAVQLASPGEVISAVAEGRARAGIALDQPVRKAMDKGAPIDLVWPSPGAIVLYSPAAVVASSADPDAALAFVDFLVSLGAQTAIAGTGWQPVRSDVEWDHAGPVVAPSWEESYGQQATLLEAYRAIYGD